MGSLIQFRSGLPQRASIDVCVELDARGAFLGNMAVCDQVKALLRERLSERVDVVVVHPESRGVRLRVSGAARAVSEARACLMAMSDLAVEFGDGRGPRGAA